MCLCEQGGGVKENVCSGNLAQRKCHMCVFFQLRRYMYILQYSTSSSGNSFVKNNQKGFSVFSSSMDEIPDK